MDDEANSLTRLVGAADTLKKLIGLLALLVHAASLYDATFFGLVKINPVVAADGSKYALIISVFSVGYVVAAHWQSLIKPPGNRPINLKLNLIAAIVLIPGLLALVDLTASYQFAHKLQDGSSWQRRQLLQWEYVAFVSVSVFLIARIAMRLYPQRKRSETVQTTKKDKGKKGAKKSK